MWSFLTNTVCHKGVFSKSVEEATSPNYLKCNPPSDDYTRNGTDKGSDGNSGWTFVRLPAIILKLQPEAFLITISDNVYNIRDGVELSSVHGCRILGNTFRNSKILEVLREASILRVFLRTTRRLVIFFISCCRSLFY